MTRFFASATLLGLIAFTLWVAHQVWMIAQDVEVPDWGWAALFVGGGLTIFVGGGLIALMYYSERMGYDEPPHQAAPEDK